MEPLRINLLISPDQHPELYARLAALPIKARAEQVRHLCSMGALNTNAPSQVVKLHATPSSFKPQAKAPKMKGKPAHPPTAVKPASQGDDSEKTTDRGNIFQPEKLDTPPVDDHKENSVRVTSGRREDAISSTDVFGGFDFSSMD